MSTNLKYVGVPLWYGCDKKGTELAPTVIRATDLLAEMRSNGICINDYGDVSIGGSTTDIHNDTLTHNMSHYDGTLCAVQSVRDIGCEVQIKGDIPIFVGGDHSLGLGSVAASAQYDSNVGVIWFDAHGDMNSEETSPTGHIHGMPLAALMGLCKSKLNDIPIHYVKPQNIFWIGTRSLDAGEQHLIEKLHLNIYSTDAVHHRGMFAIMAEIATKMQSLNISNVHCSFDVDAMDPTIMAATGCLVPNGLNNTDFDIFVQSIASLQQHIIALDFVEYNPLLDDPQQTSLEWCCHALKQLCNAIVRNNG